MTIVLGDFNARSNNWCKSDIISIEDYDWHYSE